MCRYHCYFFGGCGHQETLLVSFCSKAPLVANLVACAPSIPLASNAARTRCRSKTDSPLYRCSWWQERAPGGANDNQPRQHASAVPFTPSPPLYASPLDSEGSASIIVQPDIDTPSLLTEHHSHSSPFSPSPPPDMAGLPLFGLKHWMSGGSVPSPRQIDAQDDTVMSLNVRVSSYAAEISETECR
ncbi:hypothetical protein BDY17DRAFT_185906 [Neohortaea acidophila]|uniref:Uncharacterized protein n=1 Tax=Neohortaea acidophila TaxID=245834 RepID=A0A6A6PMF7_9PEZI|nr:uncharacterized protein BDY17DRAFT_185906 [Neohortaea acidophila]KAF2481288.1 hypothetical protein BDY17DRAFT_185906 [Neohortaea acidophila]